MQNIAGPELLLGDIILAHGVCEAEAAEKGVTVEEHAAHLVVHGTLHLLGYDHHDDADAADMEAREVRALARLGIAQSLRGRSLMATRQDDDGGSRLWRGMRHLIFGDEAEPTLRDADRGSDRGSRGCAARRRRSSARPSGRCCATCCISATRPPATSASRAATSSRCRRRSASTIWSSAFADAGHSRLPVYGESLDEVIGMIHIKDVFMANVDRDARPVDRQR